MLPKAGKHMAYTAQQTVYENQNGTLVFAADFNLDADTSIMGYFSLTRRDGGLNDRTIQNLREVYGWDGMDPFWLIDTDLSQIQVQLTVVEEAREDGSVFSNVRYLDKPGAGRQGLADPGDRNAILTKYGNRFRALAGGASVPSPKAPTAPAPKAPPAPPPADAPGETASMQEAWDQFCIASGEDTAPEKLGKEWHKAVKELIGKAQNEATPEDWGRLIAGLDDYLKDQLPF